MVWLYVGFRRSGKLETAEEEYIYIYKGAKGGAGGFIKAGRVAWVILPD